jgi:hypothetical protein
VTAKGTNNPATHGANAILASYLAQVAPKLARLGEIAEAIMAILRDPPHLKDQAGADRLPIDDRVKYLSTWVAAAAPGIIAERGALAADLSSIEKRTEMNLLRWLEGQRAAVAEARALDPDSDTTEGRARRITMAIQAEDLSRLPTEQLVSTGRRALAEGDVQAAQIRLAAARLRAEPNQRGFVDDFALALDKVLDTTVQHRLVAAKQLAEAHSAYGRVQSEILSVGQLSARLARDPSPSPDGDPGFGSTAAERAAAKAEGHEHVMAKLRDWLRRHPPMTA